MSERDEQLLCELKSLSQAISQQTEAISRLANSNAMLAQALLEQIDEDGEQSPTGYLDGSPMG